MAITVAEIFERTRRLLLDEGGTRWPDAEMVDWYNEGLLDMVTRRPSLLASIDTLACVPGTLQSVPVGRIAIIDLGQNLGSAAKPRNGGIPRSMTKDALDRMYPDWQYASTGSMVKVVVGDPNHPNQFWVFPPQPAINPGRLTITFSKRPGVVLVADIATTNFEMNDEYAPVAIEYLLYRSELKDAENPSSGQRAAQHLQNYLGLLGVNTQQAQPQQG